jgi:NADH-quinone oxidoreductase subunit K
MSIELIINAANINLIAFTRWISPKQEVGQIFVIFVIVLAAAAAAVGLAIVLAIYRNRKTIYTDEINLLKW